MAYFVGIEISQRQVSTSMLDQAGDSGAASA
jgi:hypothetical protein